MSGNLIGESGTEYEITVNTTNNDNGVVARNLSVSSTYENFFRGSDKINFFNDDVRIADLNSRITNLEALVNTVLERLDTLEASNNKLLRIKDVAGSIGNKENR